jgi:hypothetical protein
MKDGLGSAVVKWGGHGQLMAFSKFHVDRWAAAFRCTLSAGSPCITCSGVLEDTRNVAEHLIEARHGVGDCGECRAPWLEIPHAKDVSR